MGILSRLDGLHQCMCDKRHCLHADRSDIHPSCLRVIHLTEQTPASRTGASCLVSHAPGCHTFPFSLYRGKAAEWPDGIFHFDLVYLEICYRLLHSILFSVIPRPSPVWRIRNYRLFMVQNRRSENILNNVCQLTFRETAYGFFYRFKEASAILLIYSVGKQRMWPPLSEVRGVVTGSSGVGYWIEPPPCSEVHGRNLS